MKVWTSLVVATSASIVHASALLQNRGNSHTLIDVKLLQEDHTVVKANITNTGAYTIRLLNKGTILDDAPTEKFRVHSRWRGHMDFLGIRKRIKTQDLGDDAFTTLAPGQSVEVDVNLAAFHDLSNGGDFLVDAEGSIPYALEGSNTLQRAVAFKSNSVDISVNGTIAASVSRAIDLEKLKKRSTSTTLDADCDGGRRNSTLQALPNCSQLATRAAYNAISGSAAKFKEFFGTTDPLIRRNVSDRFAAVAVECSTNMAGVTQLHCVDVYAACDGNTLAYTVPTNNVVINCPEYYTYLPVITNVCHGQDMATTTLHEMTHAPGVYSPPTSDFGYGYDGLKALTSEQNVLNADTYALYANSLYTKC